MWKNENIVQRWFGHFLLAWALLIAVNGIAVVSGLISFELAGGLALAYLAVYQAAFAWAISRNPGTTLGPRLRALIAMPLAMLALVSGAIGAVIVFG